MSKIECHQFLIRKENFEQDVKESGLSYDEIELLSVNDFTFEFVDKDSDKTDEIKEFINRHEWLGKMSLFPTHRFTARYKGILAGVIVMDMPNAFSKLVGENTRKMERLISRGACISWSPKNLASSLIMWSINWMVKNTRYRVFTAYSDPEAGELGTIYQACNFIYLGQSYGTTKMYKHPSEDKWFSSRKFRSRSTYKRLAKENGIEWGSDWNTRNTINWVNIPDDIEKEIRRLSKEYKEECIEKNQPPKHKYVYLKGRSKKETKELHNLFEENNPELVGLEYPKKRGI